MSISPGLDSVQKIFAESELALLDMSRVPNHIAIIMDGNRRWASQKGFPLAMGHWEGGEGLTDIVRAAAELGVKTLTVFAFSTENWHRSQEEIQELMNLFQVLLVKKRDLMVQEGICLHAIGDLSKLPPNVLKAFKETRKATEKGKKINLVLAMNYGARDELRRAAVKILQDFEKKGLDPESLTETLMAKYLDTAGLGDPELLIRTSGEQRVSNFLLWQIAYAEIYTTNVLWPDFQPRELLQAILAYQSRLRRLGK